MPSERSTATAAVYSGSLLAGRLIELMDEAAQAELVRAGRSQILDKGSLVLTRGERPNGIFILDEGRAKVLFKDEPERSVRFMESGEIAALTETLADKPVSYDLETETACRITVISGEDLERILKNSPDASFGLAKLLSENFLESFESLRQQPAEM